MPNESMGLVGRKLGMTQIYNDEGIIRPCTVVQCGPNTVLQVKTSDGRDGYNALQFGFGEQKPKRLTKAQLGHSKKAGVEHGVRYVREVRVDADTVANHEPGKTLGPADVFEVGAIIDVTGISKGKGFQGVMKRHGFSGGRATHGSMFHRAPGSIGQASDPSRVFPGQKLPGRMGGKRVTTKNVKVVKVDEEQDLLYLKGPVPGPNNGYIAIKRAKRG